MRLGHGVARKVLEEGVNEDFAVAELYFHLPVQKALFFGAIGEHLTLRCLL
jgi:hypothetical protein